MKKILTVIALCAPLFALAQIEKGKTFISGTLQLENYSNGGDGYNTKTTSFAIGASVGRLLTDRFAIGITPVVQTNVSTTTGDFKTHETQVNIGAFGRYYFPVGERFYFHLDGGVDLGFVKSRTENAGGTLISESEGKEYRIGVRPGASYFLTDKVALQAFIGDVSFQSIIDSDVDNKPGIFTFKFDITSIAFGASVYF